MNTHWLGLVLGCCVSAAYAREAPAQRGQLETMPVYLNGTRFLEAFDANDSHRQPYVRVSALRHAIDGTGRSGPRLHVSGTVLAARDTGGCAGCPARVIRAVVISTRVEEVDGQSVLPLADVVAAFEARLERAGPPDRLTIYAGRCTWCVLAPAPRLSHP